MRGRPLIEWHIEALARAGVRDIVINTAWLEALFPAALGDGSRWNVRIHYSMEGRDHGGALETAGGMAKALPLLGEVFWALAGDVYVPDFGFDAAVARRFAEGRDWGHLWLTDNPVHHPAGDFALTADGRLRRRDTAPADAPCLTYSTIGLYRAEMVRHVPAGTQAALRPCLERAIDQNRLGGERLSGAWVDVGTPERLSALNA